MKLEEQFERAESMMGNTVIDTRTLCTGICEPPTTVVRYGENNDPKVFVYHRDAAVPMEHLVPYISSEVELYKKAKFFDHFYYDGRRHPITEVYLDSAGLAKVCGRFGCHYFLKRVGFDHDTDQEELHNRAMRFVGKVIGYEGGGYTVTEVGWSYEVEHGFIVGKYLRDNKLKHCAVARRAETWLPVAHLDLAPFENIQAEKERVETARQFPKLRYQGEEYEIDSVRLVYNGAANTSGSVDKYLKERGVCAVIDFQHKCRSVPVNCPDVELVEPPLLEEKVERAQRLIERGHVVCYKSGYCEKVSYPITIEESGDVYVSCERGRINIDKLE